MKIQLINCSITVKNVSRSTPDDIRRVTEYLEAMGPTEFSFIMEDLQIIGSALILHLAAARDLGLIRLVERKYEVV